MLASVVDRACVQALVVNDGAPPGAASAASPPLWVAGADAIVQPSIPLPFAVAEKALSCNSRATPSCGGFDPPDDYALVFTPSSGDAPLSLATGQMGTLPLTTGSTLQQHLTVRDLRSFQPDACDDYWNWGWWAAGDVGADGQLR